MKKIQYQEKSITWNFILEELKLSLKDAKLIIYNIAGAIGVLTMFGYKPESNIIIEIISKFNVFSSFSNSLLNRIGIYFPTLIIQLILIYYLFVGINLRGKFKKYPIIKKEETDSLTIFLIIFNLIGFAIWFFYPLYTENQKGFLSISLFFIIIIVILLSVFGNLFLNLIEHIVDLRHKIVYIILAPFALLISYYLIFYPKNFFESLVGTPEPLSSIGIMIFVISYQMIAIALTISFLTPILTYILQVPRALFGFIFSIITAIVLDNLIALV